jgi:hypothetical protein
MTTYLLAIVANALADGSCWTNPDGEVAPGVPHRDDARRLVAGTAAAYILEIAS